MYDRACEFWQLLLQVLTPLFAYMDARRRTRIISQMWSAHQRFFRCGSGDLCLVMMTIITPSKPCLAASAMRFDPLGRRTSNDHVLC